MKGEISALNRAGSLLRKQFIQKIYDKQPGQVGAEVELPVVRLNREPLELAFAIELMELMYSVGFEPAARTAEGYCYRAVNGAGDTVSFDTTWNTIEFSLAHARSVTELASRFYGYMDIVQAFAGREGYVICGRGLHPYAEHIDITPLSTGELTAKSMFLNQFTSHRDGDIFFAIPSATQTHIDCGRSEYIAVFNLLRGLVFADTSLFANSLPPSEAIIKKHPALAKASRTTVCYRDEIYRLSEAPNTFPDDRVFQSFEDLEDYLAELSVFIVTDGAGGFRHIRPAPFGRYFSDCANPEADMTFFRPLQPVSPSRYGTLELRGTCTQPMTEIFAPVAFYAGIAEMWEDAALLLRNFREENRITDSPMAIRSQIAEGKFTRYGAQLQDFLHSLVSCAREGLIKRGAAEERLLRPLSEQKIFKSPALRERELHDKGVPAAEIIRTLGAWREDTL